jgi:hypothetical protein
MLLLILWITATATQWVFVHRGREGADKSRVGRGPQRRHRRTAGRFERTHDSESAVILFVAVPTSVIYGVCCFVLLFSAPTVRFNAGSSWAMDLWSFWVHWWELLYYCVIVQAVCYFVWTIVSFKRAHLPWQRGVLICGCLASAVGRLLLSMAYPTA